MTPALFALAIFAQAASLVAQQPPLANGAPRRVSPVLVFPQAGLDDTAAYLGYETRFYRDSKNNTVQIYRGPHDGRVVLLWADALDESAGFTARDARGRPVRVDWDGDSATVADAASARTISFRLRAATPSVVLGWFLLGSMRVERDFQYAHAHLRPYAAPPFIVPPESTLVANVARLPAAERRRQLQLLHAGSVAELRARLTPAFTTHRSDTAWSVRIERPALDGQSHLSIELLGDPRQSHARVIGRTVSIRARARSSSSLIVRVTTDGAALTAIARDEIFSPAFLDFLFEARATGDTTVRYRRLEREVRSVELLSSNEKLMAGLPNYATYFGRDGLMTALMMRSIWTPAMSERVIASVLEKLGPSGDVSHEEALGEQAIRESADEYNTLEADYFRFARKGDRVHADSSLAAARDVLLRLRRVRENYHMMDDEFQLPVLEALYLADSALPAERKRAFLLARSSGGASHLALMLREMALVATETRAFARDPVATNLVSFEKRDSTHWRSASWRDSDVGYANGRFAMDINAIWAPHALRSIASALTALHALGFTNPELDSIAPGIARSPLGEWFDDSTSLHRAIDSWRRARSLFTVALGPREIAQHARDRLAALPQAERAYWEKTMSLAPGSGDSLVFLALALDARGSPIAVVNTDPSTDLFLSALTARGMNRTVTASEVTLEVGPFMRNYPVGLFVDGLGPVVANDAFAPPQVWDAFRREPYHSPRVVWGREVNLFLLGVAGRISAEAEASGRLADPALASNVRHLRTSLERVLAAVSASGVQHNELWSYRIEGGRLLPTRYGTSSDVQLWSTTDLAVQFALSHLPRE